MLLLCTLVGVFAGLGAIALYWAMNLGQHLLLDRLAGYRPDGAAGELQLIKPSARPFTRWVLLVLPAFGGLLSGMLVFFLAPEAEGHGTDAVIRAYHHKRAEIRLRVPFVKTIASAITIGSGGSGGREGPIAQIGAGVGSALGKLLKLSVREKRMLVAAGMAAGIGAIFHAPLAGGLFAAEVLYRSSEMEYEVIVPSFVSSIIAYAIFTQQFGVSALFITPDYTFHGLAELGPYLVLALVVAAGAYVYAKFFYGVRNFFTRLKIPFFLKPALGGLAVGVVGFFLPDAIGTGYGVLQKALSGSEIGWKFLIAVALFKIVTTSFSIGSGGSGGVFGPAVVIGGALGGATVVLAQRIFPGIPLDTGAFAIVGMAGFFSACANTPISTIIMVSEMTGNYHLLVPSMWVSVIAYVLARRGNIYEEQLSTRIDADYHLNEAMVDVLKRVMVSDVAFAPDRIPMRGVREKTTLKELHHMMVETGRSWFPVTDEEKKLMGLIDGGLLRKAVIDGGLSDLIVAKDLMAEPFFVTPNETLYAATEKLGQFQAEGIPVVENSASLKLITTLNRADILLAYDRRIVETRS